MQWLAADPSAYRGFDSRDNLFEVPHLVDVIKEVAVGEVIRVRLR